MEFAGSADLEIASESCQVETFDVGTDAGTPVSDKYSVENHFPYTGELDKIVVKLTGADAFEHEREAEVTSGF